MLGSGRRVAVVGHAADKFTPETEARAREVIRGLLTGAELMVSGGCHLGGVDIFAEEAAAETGVPTLVHAPTSFRWSGRGGYRERNLTIARDCTEAHCVVVRDYPPGYEGMRFSWCYHCEDRRPDHVKSGGCWTVMRAEDNGKEARWHIV